MTRCYLCDAAAAAKGGLAYVILCLGCVTSLDDARAAHAPRAAAADVALVRSRLQAANINTPVGLLRYARTFEQQSEATASAVTWTLRSWSIP